MASSENNGFILPVVLELIKLLNGGGASEDIKKMKQERKNLRFVKRTRKQLYRTYKKGGFTEQELKSLEELDKNILKRALELGM